MTTAWATNIIRVSTGKLNTVNESVIAGQAKLGNISRYAGQLGKEIWVSNAQATQMSDSTVGTLYAGRYRYVRFRTGDTAPVVGQLAFWDVSLTNWQTFFQVTSDETRVATNAILIAGVFISVPTAGNYCFIQDVGLCTVKFRAALTAAGAIGSRVFAAGAGAGADNGLADVLTTGATSTDIMARYLGNATVAPTNGGTAPVMLRFQNVLGA